jgi:type I restriction enzyme, S subunit
VLLSFKLTIGRVAVAGCPLYTNEAIAGLRSPKIAQEFLYHGLQHWDLLKGVDQAIKGATLNKEKLNRVEFSFPDQHAEQAKIAEILSQVAHAIEDTEALIAKQRRIKVGLMRSLLANGIDRNGKIRSEKTHEYQNSRLGRIPIEWEVTPANKLCTAVIDCKNRTPPAAPEGRLVIRTPNVRDGEFVFSDLCTRTRIRTRYGPHVESRKPETWSSRARRLLVKVARYHAI